MIPESRFQFSDAVESYLVNNALFEVIRMDS